ncbi:MULTISPECIES: asparagine synthase (glutamine-hydrolyzing) [Bradyrhizobium]|jgi:asparagine synthase (glutamine-hydrolysing)|uniref:asparagine synthase (glutamine-hydrolyzing) n=1 Tax=Bradyrhizobium TaxID=374 RepID=UPI0004837904|nr:MULTISPECIES: asparagine synthase (glutamine-hydrolyzing) [Bradyrhizobium]MCS3451014.1 asparagine synthase (glutamine-hydrolyzing) [Bradyrhizobium elkanii]MCS3557840.1 asparagine synthase (glutamine-hydrolyzing) [Bradyrhizobium elkanii]MCW2152313.1 asparagine synthase (glutamine-hydrolyzing) [Bradyrhizobium elkanii]MCW2357811.1 asparagine synthase (glutamine-hydrolyzing) [Bradyrhizobium elkanii]MCW2376043.1 asparagine synthase (glutamine-hydrolyzing) [Bradyrhizobium elkanii]
MCGIAGILNFDRQRPVDRELVVAMTRAVAHRGPDAEGIWVNGPVGLGHRRLSIIDLSVAAEQPMVSDDGQVRIVYNGEVYNFVELRRELQKRGYAFRTSSDTEVILQAYRCYGVDFLTRLRGMFALAIWDAGQRTLLLARDRIGIKPLYYHIGQDSVSFASELKSLLADPRTPREVDQAALADFLHLLSIPDPQSILKGIRRLEAGHVLIVRGRDVQDREYWSVPLPAAPRALSLADACAEFDERFGSAVRSHLVADVPVGAFLSGGVDSSSVVALVGPQASAGMRTFSVVFRGDEVFDEGPYARAVAERYGTAHREIDLGAEAGDFLPAMAWHCDEPFAVSSALGIYFLAKAARDDGIKVVLTGDGGDEVFAGYTWRHQDFVPLLGQKYGPLQRLLARTGAIGNRIAPGHRLWRAMSRDQRESGRYIDSYACFRDMDLVDFVHPDLWPHLKEAWSNNVTAQHYDATIGQPELTRKLYTDMKSSLIGEMLTKVDRLTMAAGVEARVPFLDHELVEWAFSLPGDLKIKGSEGKLIVKKAMESRLPTDILYRPKAGFNLPLGKWLRTGLKDMVYDLLSPASVARRGYFRPDVVSTMVDRHMKGGDDIGNRLFVLLMLELWHRQVLDPGHSAMTVGSAA